MNSQLDTRIISNFLLYLDHVIQSEGQAYQNVVARFYPVASPIVGSYVFSSPIKPFCNDTSVSGANILSGLYLGNQYVSIGQSGLKAINHYQGTVYFTGINPSGSTISGSAALKEINIKLTDQPDWKLLFETQYVTNNTNPVSPSTGLPLDAETTPIVFIRHKAQENRPFGFARLDNQTINIRAIAVCDNEFQKLNVTTILKNLNLRPIPMVTPSFDFLGNMTGVNFDYDTAPQDNSVTPIILGVKVIDIPQQGEFRNVVRNMAIVDFEISTIARS